MMLAFFSTRNKRSQLGVDFLPTGVAVVEVARGGKTPGSVMQSVFLPSAGLKQQAQALAEWVEHNKLQHSSCNCLLARHDVQILQLEKPPVTKDELLQAVKWKVKDLISYEVEQAVVDVYQLPHSPKTPREYINAVVANESVVQGYVDAIRQASLTLQVLDVYELVSKNYCHFCTLDAATVMLLQFADNEGLLTVYHQKDLYVARDFKIGLLDMEAALAQDEAIYDALLLELQRSMDYFESSYGLGQAQNLLVFPPGAGTGRMAKYLQNYVNYDIGFISVPHADNGADDRLEAHCFPAYCAALRGIVA